MSMPKAARIEMKKELSRVLDELTALPPAITAKEVHKSDSGFFPVEKFTDMILRRRVRR